MHALIIFCATYFIYGIVGGALGDMAGRFSWPKAAHFALALALGYGGKEVLSHLYAHVQPFAAQGFMPLIPHAVDNAFPSDHMLFAAVLASVVFIYDRKLGVVLWALALATGAARVAAGLHYPVDIAAAAVVGIIAAVAAKMLVSYFVQRIAEY